MAGNDVRELEEIFARLNGRAPTESEVKAALAFSDVVRNYNLDPFLLLWISDINAREHREQLPAEIRVEMDAGIQRLTATLGGKSISQRVDEVVATAALERRSQALELTLGSIDGALKRSWKLSAIVTAFVAAVAIGASLTFWKAGYDNGARSASYGAACLLLTGVNDVAKQRRHAETLSDLRDTVNDICPTLRE